MAPLNVNKAACLKPVLGEMERKLISVCITNEAGYIIEKNVNV